MPPACASAARDGESLLILVLPVPGCHEEPFIPNDRWFLPRVPSSYREGCAQREGTVASSAVTVGSRSSVVLAASIEEFPAQK
jgi:hypothetical protein